MIREFVYVDVTRVRSLLAQLDWGVVEGAVSRRTYGKGLGIGAGMFGVSGTASLRSDQAYEESRSLQDLLFTVFEEAAQAEGVLQDADGELVSSPERWESNEVHNHLIEGEIIRVPCTVLMVDPEFIEARFKRFLALNDALVEMNRLQVDNLVRTLEEQLKTTVEETLKEKKSTGMGKDQLRKERLQLEGQMRRATREAKDQAATGIQGADLDSVNAIFEVVNRFLSSDAIAVRFLVCGESRPDLAFTGSLLGRDDYIQREREALFARYGSVLHGWTAVLQLASVPNREAAAEARSRDFSNLQLARDEVIDRAAFEQVAIQLIEHLEARGVAEGPRWPAVSVVPLAIYRVVPRSDRVRGSNE